MLLTSKPLQKISWAKKIKDDYAWFKQNGEHLISASIFGDQTGSGGHTARLKTLYEIYNSKFPTSWFKHVTDPFSTTASSNRIWPAKIRPTNILRPNIEFLRGEYPKRPFNYQVVVKGEDGYNGFLEGKKKAAYDAISQIFINTLNEQDEQSAQEGGPTLNTGIDSKPTDMPDEAVDKFSGTFKNILAVQAQTDIDLIMEEQRVLEKLKDMMKDWLIAGEAYSYKNVLRDETIYEHVSPLEIDYDKSPHVKLVQDGDWVVRRMLMTVSDVVDRFYDSLKPKDIDKLEDGTYTQSPAFFLNYLQNHFADNSKVPVYHYTFRSMEKVGYLSYLDPITGNPENDLVNEDYKANPELGETIDWFWRTRWMEGYRIGEDLHLEMGPVRFAPSMMNNFAKSQGPYNGKRFSDTHAENVSILKLGLPFQIMHVIAGFALERTLAKSRGKVVLLDQNVIPRGEGWDEEKFFHFSEAQGWGLINRNQLGVDKSFNQYQVLDLGLFDHITHLIQIMDFCKRQYDEQIGITAPAKGQTTSADSATGVQTSVFQSSIITDMIFAEFEELRRSDMEGLLDCSQISNIFGKKAAYQGSEGRTELLNIIGEEYCYAQMGIMMTDSTKENDALNKIRQYSQAFAQNGATPSTVIAIETATNIAKLKELMLSVERKQQEMEQQSAESEQEAQVNQIQLKQQFDEFNALLDTQKMHEEYNRKEDLVLIQGDINMALAAATQEGSGAEADTAGTEALMKYATEREKIAADGERKDKELAAKVKAAQNKQQLAQNALIHKQKMAEKDHALKTQIKQKELQIKKQTARSKATAKK